MAEEGPNNKAEIQEIFRRLKLNSANRVCFDCSAINPTWASVTYGVFICIDCSAVHRSLGVHVTFVRSTQLDTNWTWSQLRAMQVGGNANASAFFAQHHATSTDAQQKYHSRAAQLYKDKLAANVAKLNRIHGPRIVFEDKLPDSAEPKDTDFFDEIQKTATAGVANLAIDNQARLFDASSSQQGPPADLKGPSVDGIISSPAPAAAPAPRKTTIGQRKPGSKLGAKKMGGLGAQKVKADFSEIEKEAEMLDQMKEKAEEQAKLDKERREEDEERTKISMSLAYQDISKQQQKRAEKMKNLDPKKAEQVERLGMGFGMRSGISHSMMTDMQVIEQETPVSSNASYASKQSGGRSKIDSFFDDFEIVERESTGLEGLSKSGRSTEDWDFDRPARKYQQEDNHYGGRSSKPSSKESSSSTAGSSAATGDEAQKKFGGAKAISSDQFFSGSADNDYERRTNLSRFEGSSSISSADYFGDGRQRNMAASNNYSQLQNVDLDDVKESVRQGVTKVAGKLSTLANGMMSSLQEKYGY